ncbi:uncharacterized protein BDZ99DRAFT_554403 [Mytilinidion resinicola]|uniref:Uncharacterized protein n=1 Tax=Mytilinidion resinicola TaxID=574789 RepID=A0A6A6YZE0_9PEZI|nr:uncharacterized protein BDZ99DRAFT_554403 [Mytilinidion resinicola]KAF2814120.1 hypothetical protein BDZ99DRAFT_554403 [Mytilinidion resinicola]
MTRLVIFLAQQRTISTSDSASDEANSEKQSSWASEFNDIYHHGSLAPGSGECLWEAGFHDIATEYDNQTPLWRHITHMKHSVGGFIGLMSWFGHLKFRATPAHVIIRRLADAALRLGNLFRGIDEWLEFSFVKSIILAPTRGHCDCHCSTDGCTPLTCAIQEAVSGATMSLLDYRHHGAVRQLPDEHERLMCQALDQVYIIVEKHKQSHPWLAVSTFQGLTFNSLNLTHTCCHKIAKYIHWPSYCLEDILNQQGIRDIHFTESQGIEMLEALMEEFEQKWEDYSEPFPNFIEDVWQLRMDEVSGKSSEVDEEEIKRIIEAGVVLEPFGPERPPEEGSSQWET